MLPYYQLSEDQLLKLAPELISKSMRALLVDAQLLHDGDDTLEHREIDLTCFGVHEKKILKTVFG